MTTLFTLPLASLPVKAQESGYRWEIGANVGMSGYFGDFNRGNMFSHPGFSVSGLGKYIIDTRWAMRLAANYSTISGDISSHIHEYPSETRQRFSSALGRLDVSAEFNFFAFGEGEAYKLLRRWSPYVGVGLGVVMASPHNTSVTVAPELPVYIGVKYKVFPRLNLSLEFAMSKMFTHKADGIKDIYGIKTKWIKNTDWSSSLTIGLSYEIGERCPACHYVE